MKRYPSISCLFQVKEQSRVYADLTLDPGTEVKKGLTYDPSGSNLYVLTENKVGLSSSYQNIFPYKRN